MVSNWLHHRHGANIPDLSSTTMLSRKQASQNMKLSPDLVSQFVGGQIDQINRERLRHLHITETINVKKELRKRWEERL